MKLLLRLGRRRLRKLKMGIQKKVTPVINLSEGFQVQFTMNIERGTALRRPPPVSFLNLKDISSQFKWLTSREDIWYHNVPHTNLAVAKGHQNWVKVIGEYLTFLGGGIQFKNGAFHYIDFIQKSLPAIAWGKRSRVILDVGCYCYLLLLSLF